MKKCSACRTERPIDCFSKHKNTVDGLQASCKSCQAAYYAARKKSNPGAIHENRVRANANRVAKYWSDPDSARAKNREAYAKNPAPVIARATAYYASNVDAIRERRRAYAESNPDAVLAWNSNYYERNHSEVRSRAKIRYHATKEETAPRRAFFAARYRAKAAKKRAEYNREYRQKYPERVRMHANRYRALKVSRTLLSDPELLALVEIEACHVARLREEVTGQKWEVDHIVPLQSPLVCGLHNEFNLRVITRFENRSKNNRHWPDMPAS
jgi:hypothetical protein